LILCRWPDQCRRALPARTRVDRPAVVVDRVVHPWAPDRIEPADL